MSQWAAQPVDGGCEIKLFRISEYLEEMRRLDEPSGDTTLSDSLFYPCYAHDILTDSLLCPLVGFTTGRSSSAGILKNPGISDLGIPGNSGELQSPGKSGQQEFQFFHVR